MVVTLAQSLHQFVHTILVVLDDAARLKIVEGSGEAICIVEDAFVRKLADAVVLGETVVQERFVALLEVLPRFVSVVRRDVSEFTLVVSGRGIEDLHEGA